LKPAAAGLQTKFFSSFVSPWPLYTARPRRHDDVRRRRAGREL